MNELPESRGGVRPARFRRRGVVVARHPSRDCEHAEEKSAPQMSVVGDQSFPKAMAGTQTSRVW